MHSNGATLYLTDTVACRIIHAYISNANDGKNNTSREIYEEIPFRKRTDFMLWTGGLNCHETRRGPPAKRRFQQLATFMEANKAISISNLRTSFFACGVSTAPGHTILIHPIRKCSLYNYGETFDEIQRSWRTAETCISDHMAIRYAFDGPTDVEGGLLTNEGRFASAAMSGKRWAWSKWKVLSS